MERLGHLRAWKCPRNARLQVQGSRSPVLFPGQPTKGLLSRPRRDPRQFVSNRAIGSTGRRDGI